MHRSRIEYLNWKVVCLLGSLILMMATVCLQAPSPAEASQGTTPSGDPTPERAIIFHVSKRATGHMDDGAFFSEGIFTAPRHETVYLTTVFYNSDGKAQAAFEGWVKRAIKVLEKGNMNGLPVRPNEQRTVIVTTSKEQKQLSMVVTTDGPRLLLISSYSLQDALEFEKQSIRR